MEEEGGKNWDTFGGEPEQELSPEELRYAIEDFRGAVYIFATLIKEGTHDSEKIAEQFRHLRELGTKLPKTVRDEQLRDLKIKFPNLPIEQI